MGNHSNSSTRKIFLKKGFKKIKFYPLQFTTVGWKQDMIYDMIWYMIEKQGWIQKIQSF